MITANQQEADIGEGQEIGYVTFQNSGGGGGVGTATVAFKDAVLELKVTPTITNDGRVFLNLQCQERRSRRLRRSAGRWQDSDDRQGREITTGVLVDNGQTVVLGGVYEFDKANSVTKVPSPAICPP